MYFKPWGQTQGFCLRYILCVTCSHYKCPKWQNLNISLGNLLHNLKFNTSKQFSSNIVFFLSLISALIPNNDMLYTPRSLLLSLTIHTFQKRNVLSTKQTMLFHFLNFPFLQIFYLLIQTLFTGACVNNYTNWRKWRNYTIQCNCRFGYIFLAILAPSLTQVPTYSSE